MTPAARAGNLWLTGHDADFHCDGSGGSQCHYFGVAANFVRQGAPNKTLPVLVLDSGTEAVNSLGATEVKALNTVEGAGNAIPFTVVDPTSPAFATTPISTANWSAIIIASDSSCGGCDNTTADITAINARTSEIQAFFSAGGGLLYLAGADNRATYYSSVPVPATGVAVSSPFTVTSVGTSLGLTSADANCCATHNSFTLPAAGSSLQVVETDSAGNAETLIASGAAICSGTPSYREQCTKPRRAGLLTRSAAKRGRVGARRGCARRGRWSQATRMQEATAEFAGADERVALEHRAKDVW
jgi:hypothetical protein